MTGGVVPVTIPYLSFLTAKIIFSSKQWAQLDILITKKPVVSSYTAGCDIVLQDTYMIGNNVTFSSVWGTPCTLDYGDCG